jgi:hypothetical protein
MSTKIKPQHGVTYECYKGFTDQYNDRCRSGQKFKWSTEHDEHEFTGYYVMEKASGRGVNIAVKMDQFAAHFIPLDAKKYLIEKTPEFPVDVKEYPTENNLEFFKIDSMELPASMIAALKELKEQIKLQFPEYFATHKVGNRYRHEDGNRYLLIGGRVSNQVALVNLKTGKVESYRVTVEDTDNITANEFNELCFDSHALKLIKERQ